MEDLLKNSKDKKEKHYKLILKFYDYVEAKTGHRIESALRNSAIIDNPVLRRLDMDTSVKDKAEPVDDVADR